jgi:hypothetical protein
MTVTCKSKNPSACRFHGATTPAETEHLEKEKLFGTGFVVSTGAEIFSSEPDDRTAFLTKRSYMLGTDNAWEISPEGSTGANCKCGAYLTRSQTEELCYQATKCTVCQKRINNISELAAPSISHDSKKFLDDDEVRKASWFHITTDPEWASNVSENAELPVVHVGTESAAQDRLTMIQDDIRYGDKVYMYEIKLKPEIDIFPEVHGDGNDFQPKTANDRDKEERGKVLRYVNSWEDAGSISLMIEGNMFSVANRTEIDPHE